MKKQNRFLIFIVYSVAAHLAFVAILLFVSLTHNNLDVDNRNVEITIIEPNELDAEYKKNNATVVVESESKTANEKIDDQSKYLSEKNNKVEKQTRAKNGAKFVNAQKFLSPQMANTAQQKSAAKESTAQQKIDLLSPGYNAYSALNKQFDEAQEKKQQAGSSGSEASMTNDNLKNVENDLITRLNTREYKYFGYYTRIKNQLNQWWVPQVQQKFNRLVRQGRSIASEQSKITKLVIILNGSGNLVKVQVLAASGVRDLDDAAVEAFRQAAPFPNPPKGMIESDGTVRIRWDCVVES